MEVANKCRLYPNKAQRELIFKTFGCVRFVYNHFIDEYLNKGVFHNFFTWHQDLIALKNVEEYSFLKEVDKFSLELGLKQAISSIERCRSHQGEKPRFKSKRNPSKSYTTKFTNSNIEIVGNKIKLPKLGCVKAKGLRHFDLPILGATISFSPTGKCFVSIVYKDFIPKEIKPKGYFLGLDLGVKSLISLSNGMTFENPKLLDAHLQQIAFYLRQLSRKSKDSQNYAKTKLKIARLFERTRNLRSDYIHQVTNRLINDGAFIAMEDLASKEMLQKGNRDLSRRLGDASFGEIIRQLTYKTRWYRIPFIKVDRYFPSSQICSSCGHLNQGMKNLSKRTYRCPICGNVMDRDHNAALNILKEGFEKYLTTGY